MSYLHSQYRKACLLFKRGFSALLCLLLVLSLTPLSASAADSVLDVTSSNDIVNALAGAASGDTFTFKLKNDIALGTGGYKLTIPAGVKVVLTNADGANVNILRHPFASNNESRIDIQGSLVIEETAGGSLGINGGGFNYEGDPILAVYGAGSSLTINSGTFSNNSSSYGMIYSADGASTTINGGTFSANSNPDPGMQGGVIWAANSNLTINGGTFEGNSASSSGGVVYYEGRSQSNALNINGGVFSNNSSNGGIGGGAIFIDSDSVAHINGGQFYGNQAKMFGGAIYIQVDAVATFSKAYIHDNSASSDGGGVWNCPTGNGDYYSFNGLYLSNNHALREGDDFFSSVENGVSKQSVYLSDYAYTGDKYNWIKDEIGEGYGQPAPSDYYQNSNQKIALESGLSNSDVAASKGASQFYGNSALSGGAIANNGYVQSGEPAKISISKQTSQSTEETFSFSLLLERDNAPIGGSFFYKSSDGSTGRISFDDAGKASLTLLSGQTITIIDLPICIHLSVEEVSIPNGWTLSSSSNTSIDITGEETSAPTIDSLFVNETNPLGNLAVSKTVSGAAADKDKEFDFLVTLGDTSISGTYGSMTFTDGKASFRLKDGESLTASNLPVGTTYTVTESNNRGYTVTVNGEDVTTAMGSIPKNDTASAAFNNHMDVAPAEVSITASKTMDGAAPTVNTFSFVLKGPDNEVIETVNNQAGSIAFSPILFSEVGSFSYTMSELPGEDPSIKYDDTVYKITVDITKNSDGSFKASVSYFKGDQATNALTFSNTTIGPSGPNSTTVSVSKVWAGVTGSSTPASISVQLYKDNEPSGTPVVLNSANNWSYSWTGLSAASEWTVDEVSVPPGFTKTISHTGNNWVITNTVNPSTPNYDNTPQTGDYSHDYLWLVLSGFSFLGFLVSSRRKQNSYVPRH